MTSLILASRDAIQPIRAQQSSTTDAPPPASLDAAAAYERSQSQYDAYRLYEDMFVYGASGQTYRKQVRPVNDYDTGLDVSIRFSLLSLIDVSKVDIN